jgi:hypothetical protein
MSQNNMTIVDANTLKQFHHKYELILEKKLRIYSKHSNRELSLFSEEALNYAIETYDNDENSKMIREDTYIINVMDETEQLAKTYDLEWGQQLCMDYDKTKILIKDELSKGHEITSFELLALLIV